MRLEGALYSSREGIMAHGQAIAVVGDNISNSNTVAFKRSRAEFQDIMAEGQEGRASETITGGAGVAVTTVRPIQETGMLEQTGRALDAGIDGSGFFMVGDEKKTYYTRAGNFQMDAEGYLTTADGQRVLGLTGSAETGTLGPINLLNVKTAGQATSSAQLYGNLNAGQTIGTKPSNPQTFEDIGKAAGYTAVLEVYDSLGAVHSVTLAFTKTAASKWNAQAYIDGGDISGGTAGKPQLLGEVDLGFGSDGVIPDASKAAAVINVAGGAYANGASASAYKISLGDMLQYSSPSQLSGITKDGMGAGQIKGYEIRSNGQVMAMLDTGSASAVGTLQLADFKNVDGLQRQGSGLYAATTESGEAQKGSPGSKNLGKLAGGSLERSTVDIANEFVDLVVYQRGYQANSQVLQTTSQMVKDTIGLMR